MSTEEATVLVLAEEAELSNSSKSEKVTDNLAVEKVENENKNAELVLIVVPED